MGTQLWAAVGGYSTLVRQLEFPADLVFYEIGISALNVLACYPPMRMKPTLWTSADFVQQTLITENSPSLAAKRKICPLEATSYCIFLKHLIVLEICCKGWLAISSDPEWETLQSSLESQKHWCKSVIIQWSYFGFFRQETKTDGMVTNKTASVF